VVEKEQRLMKITFRFKIGVKGKRRSKTANIREFYLAFNTLPGLQEYMPIAT
jgi:hypothetical protein